MSNSNIGKEQIVSGTVIDNRYLIQTILGQGGLGRTYLAFDTHRFNEPCVLKEFAPLDSGQYDLEKSRNLFKREAKILHCINHPQIPKFLACFEVGKQLFLVQEFVNGKTYSAILKNRQRKKQAFTERQVIKWLMDVLPILDYIHQRGIIHRDISPDNIMQPEGEQLPVLIDFGVGKLTNNNINQESGKFGTAKHSYVGKMSFVGKIGYAPIEQMSIGKCSPSSDLYSLGVTALVLLTGKEPTALLNQDSLEWEWKKYIKVGTHFAEFISKMTEARPLKRYQTAKDALKDLEIYFADLDTAIQKMEQEKIPQFPSQQKLFNSESNGRKLPLRDRRKPPLRDRKTRLQKNQNGDSQALKNPSQQATLFPNRKQTTNKSKNNLSPSDLPKDIAQPISNNDNQEENTIILGLNQPKSDSKKKPLKSTIKSPNEQQNNIEFDFDDDTMIAPSFASNSAPSQSLEFDEESELVSNSLNSEFIQACQQELAYFIGPMATLIVDETLDRNQSYSPGSFIATLAQQIPSKELQIQFKKRLSMNN